MNARWTVLLAVCSAVLLCGALLATAAEPSIAQNRPVAKGPAETIQKATLVGTTVPGPQGEKLGKIKNVALDPQPGTHSAAALVDNPSASCPCVVPPPCPCVVYVPCETPWPQSLRDFASE